LPVEQVLNIVAQVALGLAYAHEHDIIHRDVKPSNIMVIRDGNVKITDFGIARMASSSVRTQTGMVLGSPKYMSPEQVMGKNIDQRSDIFSLGVMLYEMLTGQAPFDGENVNAIMYQTLNAITPPPSTLNPSVPEMVNFIVAKALAKGVEDRYQNAKDFAVDLRTCCDTMPRTGQQVDISKTPAGGEKKLPDTIEISGRMGVSEEEGKSASYAGLSKAFDSSVATMRLAALTATSEDVDELSKTFNMGRPSPETIIQAGLAARVVDPVFPAQPRQDDIQNLARPSTRPRGGRLLLIIIALLMLSGIILIFAF
jgi:eukaryotic-like serine/threonine-protein kinase